MNRNEKEQLSKMDMPLYGGFVCTIASFILNLLAFSSPYWIESYAETNSAFLRMGIWEVCFDGFLHPQDARANVWRGCFWIFDRRFFDTKLWYYLDPPWMIACQVLSVIAFLMFIVATLVMVLYFLYYGQPAAESIIACICEIFGGILVLIVVIIFGSFSEDRNWMPRPDHNHLSWSFAFAVLSAVVAFVAGVFLTCLARTDKALQKEVEYMERFGDYGQVDTPGFTAGSRHDGHRRGPPSIQQARPYTPIVPADPIQPAHGYRHSPPPGSLPSRDQESLPPTGPGSIASSRMHTLHTGQSTVHVPMGPGGSSMA